MLNKIKTTFLVIELIFMAASALLKLALWLNKRKVLARQQSVETAYAIHDISQTDQA